jgi:hypothetical protein
VAVRLVLSIAMLLCVSIPALAQPGCTEPQMPAPVDGASVNPDQLRAAVAAAKGFIAQSDVYQSCLMGELDAAKTQAGTEGHTVDPTLESQTRLRLAANQKTKEKVGVEINTAIDVFKKTHVK